MELKVLKNLWTWLQEMPKQTLVLLILLMGMCIILLYVPNRIELSLKNQQKEQIEAKQKQEKYVEDISPKVSHLLTHFLYLDTLATNVLVLNYHNSIVSVHGLAYRYITCIKEEFRTEPCSDYWKELDYLNYGPEIVKVHNAGVLKLNLEHEQAEEYPHLKHIIKKSNADYAVFYPLVGQNDVVGLVVVLYKNAEPNISTEYMLKIILPFTQPLGSLLDYNSHIKN